MLRGQATYRGDALAVLDGVTRLRLAQLRRQAGQGARALIATGVQPGDRVAIMAPNGWRWAVAAFAVWDTGAQLVPVSTQFKGDEAGHVLERAQVSVLLAGDDDGAASPLSRLAEACGEPFFGRPYAGLPSLRAVVVLDGVQGAGGSGETRRPGVWRLRHFVGHGASVAERVAEQRALSVQPADPCELLCTPTAAGGLKETVLGHGQVLASYWDWSEVVTLTEGDRYPVLAPLSDGFGLNAGLLACVMRGATMIPVAAPDPASPDPAALAGLIERQRVSVLAGPPDLFYRLLDGLPGTRRDLSSLRMAVCGTGTAPPELIRRMRAQTGVRQMINAYGLS